MDVEMHLLWIVPTATLIGIIFNAGVAFYLNYKALEQAKNLNKITNDILESNRITELIIQERIKWTRDLRLYLVDFNKCVSEVVSEKKEKEQKIDYFIELRKNFDQILLMLNPNEKYHVKVIEAHSEILKYAYSVFKKKDKPVPLKRSELSKLQNVLLKSEWARIKQETDSGKILTDIEVENIYAKFEEKAFNTKINDEIDNT